MSDWEIVQQLAAEFQKVQATSGVQKLSERNCVEVVTKLVSMGLLDVLHTLDGKEYITPQHLEREIRDELIVNKGRLNIVDLQQTLNVDLSHIEAKVGDILKRDRNIVLLQGELIDKSYVSALCEEVNETLQEVGQVAIADLSRNFGLPNNFLMEHIEASIGTRIKGQLDKSGSGAIYTDAFVARYVSRIRGLFSGVTQPTAIGPLITQGSFQEKLFLSVLHELVAKGNLPGSLHGHMEKAVYIPHVYTRMQNKWADSFFASNGYLEYDALSRLGIENPAVFVSQRYSSRSDVVELVSCVVGDGVMTELGARLEEALATDGWVDVLTLLPTPCTVEDAELLVQKKFSSDPELKITDEFLIKKSFIQSCCDYFKQKVQEKAQKAVAADAVRVSEMIQRSLEMEEAPKASGRKRGGRDKKSKGKKSADSHEGIQKTDSSKWGLHFMTVEEMNAELLKNFPDCSENVITEIATDIIHPLQSAFLGELKACLATLGQSSSASQQRKKHANTQERVQGLWTNAKLFERAIELFEGDAVLQLSKYLLKTVCSDLVNMILIYMSDCSTQDTPEEVTPKDRAKLISALSDQSKGMMSDLDKSLTGKSTEIFFELFDKVCAEDFCGIMLKKADKKKEKQLLFSHQQSLLGSLREEAEPAMTLHLITVILFQQHTGQIVHIPGKLVPLVISFLAQHLDQSLFLKLAECQKLVSDQLRSVSENSVQDDSPSSGADHSQNTDKLNSLLIELKDSLLTKPKKNVVAEN